LVVDRVVDPRSTGGIDHRACGTGQLRVRTQCPRPGDRVVLEHEVARGILAAQAKEAESALEADELLARAAGPYTRIAVDPERVLEGEYGVEPVSEIFLAPEAETRAGEAATVDGAEFV